MDWTTIIGVLAGIGIIGYGLLESQSLQAFLNTHGLILVIGGGLSATLISTPASIFFDAMRAGLGLFIRPNLLAPGAVIRVIMDLAEKARRAGNLSIENDGQGVGDGFLQTAIDACLTTADQKMAHEVLVQKLQQIRMRHTETANVFRTMGVLFPMFGLVGTIIGIVTVLQNISNPKNVGPAMAVALSTAFFGILISNLICVPAATKLRFRSGQELLVKEIMAEGLLRILFTADLPSQIGLYLESYVKKAVERNLELAIGAPQGAPRPTV